MKSFRNFGELDIDKPDFSVLKDQGSEGLLSIWKTDGVVRTLSVEQEIAGHVLQLATGSTAAGIQDLFCASPESAQLFTEFLAVAVERRWIEIVHLDEPEL